MLPIAVLNDMELKVVDIKNPFLTSPNTEKHYIISGTDFRVHIGNVFILVNALYGLKSAGSILELIWHNNYVKWDVTPPWQIRMCR